MAVNERNQPGTTRPNPGPYEPHQPLPQATPEVVRKEKDKYFGEHDKEILDKVDEKIRVMKEDVNDSLEAFAWWCTGVLVVTLLSGFAFMKWVM